MNLKGDENVADGLTKHVDRQKVEQHMCDGAFATNFVRDLETVTECRGVCFI